MPWGVNATYSGTPAAGASSVLTTTPLPLGQSGFVKSLTFGASRACDVRLQITPNNGSALGFGTIGPGEISFTYSGGVVQVPYGDVLWGSTWINVQLIGETGSDAIKVHAGLSGYRIADDMRFDAAKVLLMVGDSIQATGPANGSYRDALAIWKVRDCLLSRGKDYRLVMKQVSGTTSSTADLWRRYGYLDAPQADLACYQMGANDATTALAPATYQANWAAFASWALARWPSCRVLFLGTTPAEKNADEAYLATLRSDMSAFVASLANPRVKYLDLGSAFDRTVSANYASTDTAGSRLHPSVQGNQAVYDNCWKPFLDANMGWIPG